MYVAFQLLDLCLYVVEFLIYSNCSCVATISNLVDNLDNLVGNSNVTEEADSRIINSPRSKCR